MKSEGVISRRRFMAVTAIAGTALASGCLSRGRAGWESLNPREAGTLTAICDQIIPADDFPSASQAGVLNFIDRQLARSYRRFRDAYRNGLRQANQLSQSTYGLDLAMASPQQQFAVVSLLEQHNREFFELVRSHTFQGYYGSPAPWRQPRCRELAHARPGRTSAARARTVRLHESARQLMKRVNAVVIGAGAAGGIVAKELDHRRAQRGSAGARQVVHSPRLPQRRSAQPAHHRPRQCLRPGR